MKLHQTTLIELSTAERQVLRAAGDRWAFAVTQNPQRTGRIKHLAKQLGIGPGTLRCWENGARRPTWAKFERWCALLGVAEIDLRLGGGNGV